MPQPLSSYLCGPLTQFGIAVAVLVAAADQGVKLWLLRVFDLGSRPPVHLGPFVDLVLAWNTGISFSLFPQVGPLGQWALVGVKTVAVMLLWIWLARAGSRLTALALGLIIGGPVGNTNDRRARCAVARFVLFQLSAARCRLPRGPFHLAHVLFRAPGVRSLVY